MNLNKLFFLLTFFYTSIESGNLKTTTMGGNLNSFKNRATNFNVNRIKKNILLKKWYLITPIAAYGTKKITEIYIKKKIESLKDKNLFEDQYIKNFHTLSTLLYGNFVIFTKDLITWTYPLFILDKVSKYALKNTKLKSVYEHSFYKKKYHYLFLGASLILKAGYWMISRKSHFNQKQREHQELQNSESLEKNKIILRFREGKLQRSNKLYIPGTKDFSPFSKKNIEKTLNNISIHTKKNTATATFQWNTKLGLDNHKKEGVKLSYFLIDFINKNKLEIIHGHSHGASVLIYCILELIKIIKDPKTSTEEAEKINYFLNNINLVFTGTPFSKKKSEIVLNILKEYGIKILFIISPLDIINDLDAFESASFNLRSISLPQLSFGASTSDSFLFETVKKYQNNRTNKPLKGVVTYINLISSATFYNDLFNTYYGDLKPGGEKLFKQTVHSLLNPITEMEIEDGTNFLDFLVQNYLKKENHGKKIPVKIDHEK